MEQITFVLSSFGIVVLAVLFGLTFSKIEKDYLNSDPFASKDFDSFLKKVKGNSSRIRY
ncbi:hypothetical protein LV89_02785 [Arcicella aurantiaca]|uniref:Uncharacterized protein n=1 Tax=Arcicella aurantiaca TaxID=591202 RepID=A0A316E715_9BACT|nr:hypothetical protein [Arcicella aurantiaca]PWK25159.1 hypothetical protein LV89_02785 [Arcicella aurantiaca]